MKLTKILSFATSLALVPFLFNSCEEKTTEPETPKDEKITLEVTPSSTITFKAKQNEDVVLTVKTNAETWDFTAPDWVVATKEESTLKVNVKDNTTKEDNIGRIEFTAGTAKKVVVAVMQEAAENDTPQVQKGEGMLVDKEGRNTVSFKVKNQEPTGKVSIVVRLGEAAQDELSVKVKLDPDFLDEYNYTNNTKCVSLPSEAVDLGAATLVVPKGATESAPLEINLNLANQEESTRYLATIAVDESSLPEGLAFPVANKRYNVVVMKELVKKIQNLVYLEVNNTNPLNLLEYRLEDGTPFFDAVVIHAANIRLNGNRVVLHKNPNIQELLDNSETYLQPLRKAGMKVLLGLLPDHTPAGLVNLSDKGAEMFAEQVADAVKTYKLDGVNLDEEYREGDSSSDLFNNLMPNGMRLIYQLNKKMNEKCDWPIFTQYLILIGLENQDMAEKRRRSLFSRFMLTILLHQGLVFLQNLGIQ